VTVELSPAAQQVVNVVLIWLGFGVLTGLLARALLPGREPRGLTGTLILGVMGSFLGPAAMSAVAGQRALNPIGPIGLLASVGGAMLLLVSYRVVIALFAPKQPDNEG
jgi:uncharacterized membrane protein YeaQ/YmgE (transglycosylase-associated protein family)